MKERLNRALKLPGLGCGTSIILFILILTSIGLGWVVNSLLIIGVLLLITPVIAFWGIQWWLRRKLIQASCPVCNYEFTGFKNKEFNCPNCGETLKAGAESFSRITPPGTIDVKAVEVSVKSIDDSK
ncbi:MAG: hypothetical protein AAFQ80_16095 [Cyanobacteria bacterium J06621_8]